MMYTIGIPKEIKANERRVSLTPNIVRKIINKNISVYVEKNAGHHAGYSDEHYIKCGATICDTAEELYANANVIIKVKEPLEAEYELINEKHIIFSFFHFASSTTLLKAMIESKASCIAYETLETFDDLPYSVYPILTPMSIIAGEQAIINAKTLINYNASDEVTIIGVGNVGRAAAYKAKELGYKNINLIETKFEKIILMEEEGFNVFKMTNENLENLLKKSKIVVGSIYNTGRIATKLISNDLLDMMQEGSIIMDIAIDQGGMTDQSKPTTITEPLILYKNIKIYCVPNIPSCVPNEASHKLSEAIFPYLLHLLESVELEDAVSKSKQFASALNVHKGKIFHKSLKPLLIDTSLYDSSIIDNITITETTNDTPVTNNTYIINIPVTINDTPLTTNDTPLISNDTPVTTNDTPLTTNDTPLTTNDTPLISNDTPVTTNDTPAT